jgi:multidrug efflux system membrane fusion protein
MKRPRNSVLAAGLAVVAITAAVLLGKGSDKGAAAPGRGGRGAAAFPVEVVAVSSRPVEYAVNAVGSVEAFEIVQVTARVPGAVERIRFVEGDLVRAGEVLVEIDPERYRLALLEAKANLEKAKAAVAEAEAGLARREGANEKTPGLIPGEEIDAWRTRVATAGADMAAAEAAVELAERNARDSGARAPFAGTIQNRNVQTGQYVQPGALLTTLVRRDPLLVRFQVPEGEAGRIAVGLVARFRVRHDALERGARIVHVGGTVDPGSRMVPVTAQVVNPDPALRPGAFAEITVPIGSPVEAPVIPQTAVRPSERGFLAYVVEAGAARERVLSLGLRTPDGLVEVKDGLAPAESLVVRGAEALRDGARVRVVPSGDPALETPRPGVSDSARGGDAPGSGAGTRP